MSYTTLFDVKLRAEGRYNLRGGSVSKYFKLIPGPIIGVKLMKQNELPASQLLLER